MAVVIMKINGKKSIKVLSYLVLKAWVFIFAGFCLDSDTVSSVFSNQ